MNRRNLLILGVITVALVILALVIEIQDREPGLEQPQRLLPKLEAQLNEISRVQIRTANAEPITIDRQEGRWVVVQKDDYPADLGLLRRELLTLARLERIEAMTRNPENYDRLGLRSVTEPQSRAREIRIWAGDQELARLWVGKTGLGGGSYVRLGEDPQSWLTSAQLTLPDHAEDWLDKDLLGLAADRIQRIEMHPTQGPAYTLVKASPQQSEFTLERSAENSTIKAGQPQRIASALSGLDFTDVLSAAKAPVSDDPWNLAVFESFDGLVIEARSRKLDDKPYLALSARVDPAQAERFKQSQGDKATAEDKADKSGASSPLKSLDKVRTEAEELQNRFTGWVFVISDYLADSLALPREELLEKPTDSKAQPSVPEGAEAPPDKPQQPPSGGDEPQQDPTGS